MVPSDPSVGAVVCACEDGHQPSLSERWNKDQVRRGRYVMHGGVLVEGVMVHCLHIQSYLPK